MGKSHVIAAISLLALAGCGGGGASGSTSPFAGTFVGPWSEPSIADSGVVQISVSGSGALTGLVHEVVAGNDGTVTGTISNAGDVHGTVVYPGITTFAITGQLSFNSQGHLAGVLLADLSNAIIFNLTRQ